MNKHAFIKRHTIVTGIMVLFFLACTKKDDSSKATSFIIPSMHKTEIINDKGINEWEAGNYPTALEHFTEAYNLAKKNNDIFMIATLLNNMGLVNWSMNNNDEAMEFYNEAAKIAEQYNYKAMLGLTHTNRSLILKLDKNFKTAFEHNDKAIAIFKEIKDTNNLAIAYNNQGQLYRASGQPDPALKYYLLSLNECKSIKYTQGVATAWQNIAAAYREKGNFKEADAAHHALNVSATIENKIRISQSYAELSLLHEKFNHPDSALYYLKKNYDNELEILDNTRNEKLSQNQAKLGMEVKNLRIENLQKEKEIAKIQLWVIISGILVLLVMIAFFVYRYFSIMRFNKRQLEMELHNSHRIIDIKEQELKTYIIDLSRKNAIISSMQENTYEPNLPSDPTEEEIAELLEQKILTDDDWEIFKSRFKAIYPDFFARIKESGIQLTEAENRLLVLMRLELNSKDMANILGISPQSVRVCKMRLKKRLPADRYASVEGFLAELTK